MARVPDVRRTGAISQVAPEEYGAGMGWAALSELARIGGEFMQPLADEKAEEKGYERVYRDKDGTLKVNKANVLGGRSAEIQNSAAYSKYLSQKRLDMQETFTELAEANKFNPAGFKEGADAYIQTIKGEDLPAALKEEVLSSAQSESRRMFNGLFNSATERNYRESERNTRAHRDMLADDYVSLYMLGEFEEAEAKLAELTELTNFRVNAPYISETEKEAEAYIRGIQGSAKLANITQRMGEGPFTDDLRAEAEALLDDPDLSPQARQRLSTAVTAAIKGVEAKGIADGLASDTYSAKVRRVESANRADAKNPNSSATGVHQFVEGTWRENVAELRAMGQAEWATGLSDAELLEMRKDPEASEEVFRHFRQKNARALAAAGLPVDDSTEYLAHFLGAGGAIKLLNSDLNATAGEVLESVIPGFSKANPGMGEMTVAEVRNWAARKMTMKASDIALAQNNIAMIEDEELRGMASRELSRMYDMRRNLEAQSLLEYQTRMVEGDGLTESEIRNDHSLADGAQNQLIKELRRVREDETTVAETIAALNAGQTFNGYDTDQRNAIDKTFKAAIGDQDALSPEGQAAGADIAVRGGVMPKSMFTAVRGALTGSDAQRFASAAELTGQILQRQPGAMQAYDGNSQVSGRLADYGFYSQFMAPEDAAARVIENNSPEMQAKRKNLSDAAKDAAKELKPDDVSSFFSDQGMKVELGSDEQMAPVMDDYDRLFRDAFTATGDVDLAKNRALTEMSRIYGPNAVTGDNRLMKYPPQASYPADINAPGGEEYAWMTEQLVEAVRPLLGDESLASSMMTALAQGLAFDDTLQAAYDPSNIRMVSDEITRREIASGKSPSYVVYYNDRDGVTQAAPERFFFDPSDMNTGDPGAFGEERQKEIENGNMLKWRQHLMDLGYPLDKASLYVMQHRDQFKLRPPGEDDALPTE